MKRKRSYSFLMILNLSQLNQSIIKWFIYQHILSCDMFIHLLCRFLFELDYSCFRLYFTPIFTFKTEKIVKCVWEECHHKIFNHQPIYTHVIYPPNHKGMNRLKNGMLIWLILMTSLFWILLLFQWIILLLFPADTIPKFFCSNEIRDACWILLHLTWRVYLSITV